MISANQHVLRRILNALEGEDLSGVLRLCRKLPMRYRDDYEIQQICSEILVYSEFKTYGGLEEVKSRLRELVDIRGLGTPSVL